MFTFIIVSTAEPIPVMYLYINLLIAKNCMVDRRLHEFCLSSCGSTIIQLHSFLKRNPCFHLHQGFLSRPCSEAVTKHVLRWIPVGFLKNALAPTPSPRWHLSRSQSLCRIFRLCLREHKGQVSRSLSLFLDWSAIESVLPSVWNAVMQRCGKHAHHVYAAWTALSALLLWFQGIPFSLSMTLGLLDRTVVYLPCLCEVRWWPVVPLFFLECTFNCEWGRFGAK